jgi:hypothetical protein
VRQHRTDVELRHPIIGDLQLTFEAMELTAADASAATPDSRLKRERLDPSDHVSGGRAGTLVSDGRRATAVPGLGAVMRLASYNVENLSTGPRR